MERISFKENDISQKPALELLQKLGYKYLSPEEALAMRGGKTSNVLLEEVLRRQLRELNSIRIGNRKEERFSEQNIENGVIAMRHVPMEGGYLSGNEAIYNMLTLGKAFEQSIDGDKKSYTMRYIDWEHPENNVYHVTEEFAVTRTGSADTYRPDIVNICVTSRMMASEDYMYIVRCCWLLATTLAVTPQRAPHRNSGVSGMRCTSIRKRN